MKALLIIKFYFLLLVRRLNHSRGNDQRQKGIALAD